MPKRLLVIALTAASLLALILLALDLSATEPHERLAAAEAAAAETGPPALVDPDAGRGRTELASPRAEEVFERAAAEPGASAVEPAVALWVEGRVVFPADTPADERAFVEASGHGFEQGAEQRVEVAPDGGFRVAFAEGTPRGSLRLAARYLYLEERLVEVDLAGELPPLVLEPMLGGRIEGRLRLSGLGRGIADLEGGAVELERTVRHGNAFILGTYRSAPIRGETFAFDALPPGAQYEVKLVADAGYGRQLGAVSIAPGVTSAVVLEVRPGVAVEGRVLDEHGAPLAGVVVQANSADPGSGSYGFGRATTASDGAFAIRGLPPGRLKVEAEAEGFATGRRELLPAGEGETLRGIDLVLERGLAITGRVRWPDGSPAGGAAIDVERGEPGLSWYQESFTSGADGSFAVGGLTEGRYDVRASAARGDPGEASAVSAEAWRALADGVAAGTSGLELVLDPGALVTGFARDDLGRLLDAFEVEAVPIDGSSWRRPHFGVFLPKEGVRRSFAGSGGRFELGGLLRGAWSVAAKAEGHVVSEAAVLRVPEDAAQELDLVVPRGGRIEGVVLAPSGSETRARVVIEDPRKPFLDEDRAARTDDTGRFALSEVAPGRVVLVATSEQAAPSDPVAVEVAPGQLVTGVVLELRRGGRITGRVVDALGAGLPGREVRMFGGSVREATADAAGRFAFENLPAGRYHLQSGPTPEELARFGATGAQDVDQLLARRAIVELEELGSADVTLAPPAVHPVAVHGRVTLSGKPFPAANLMAHNGESGFTSVQADERGAFELLLPAPGAYLVLVQSFATGVQSSVEIDVPDVERFAFDVEIPAGTIAGTVVDSAGRPIAGIAVEAELVAAPDGRRVGQAGGRATTGADGSFRLEVPAGTHDVAAGVRHPWSEAPGSFAPARARGVAVAAGAAVSGLEIRLGLGGSVEGTVEGEDGGPPGQLWVVAVDAAGEDAGSAQTDAVGAFRMDGLPPGRLRIQAFDQPQRITSAATLEVRAGETARVALRLTRGTRLCARVLDASGAPIEADAVELLDADGAVVAEASRDAGGLYLLGLLPNGTHVVRARRLGKTCERRVDLAGGEATVELVIE